MPNAVNHLQDYLVAVITSKVINKKTGKSMTNATEFQRFYFKDGKLSLLNVRVADLQACDDICAA